MSSDDYTRNDVKAAKQQVAAACPDVILEDWQDYGYKLVGYKPGPKDLIVLFQPERNENGQEFIRADIDAAIRQWGGAP